MGKARLIRLLIGLITVTSGYNSIDNVRLDVRLGEVGQPRNLDH